MRSLPHYIIVKTLLTIFILQKETFSKIFNPLRIPLENKQTNRQLLMNYIMFQK